MARTDLPTFDVRPHYYYLVKWKLSTETAATLLGQVKTLDINRSADQKQFNRVGAKDAKKVAGSIGTDVTLTLYWDSNAKELAHVLGQAYPAGTGGWLGTEEISLDPAIKGDFTIEGYDGTGTDATLLTTETITDFQPAGLKCGIDSEGDARTAEITGAGVTHKIAPEAGT